MNVNKLFRRLPIRTKLTIAFALMALLPLTIIGIYGLWITNESLEANAIAQVRHHIDLVKVNVDHLLASTRSDLMYLEKLDRFAEFARRAPAGAGIEPESTLIEAIARFCTSHPVYFQIRYLDLDGEELLRVVDLGDRYGYLPPRRETASGAQFYRHASEGMGQQAFLSVPVELKHPVAPGRLVPALSFVGFSHEESGRPRGLWVADLYAERLIEVLKKPPIVPGGELVLCDAQGHYLYHPTKKKGWSQLLASQATDNVYRDWPPAVARAILTQDEGVVTGLGKDIIAHTTVWSDPSEPRRGYALYYRMPTQIAFAPARRFAGIFTVLGVLSMALVVGAAYLGAGQLTRPVVALSQGARIIAGGNFGHRIDVQSNDEIETLADDFNRMAEAMAERDRLISEHEARLKRYAEGLEGMVEARTAELEESQRLLAHLEKMAAVGKLAAGLAHEINNPVGIILNRIETMQAAHREVPAEGLREDLEVLARHGRRIASITEDLLHFSRPRVLARSEVDLRNVCSSVVALIRPEFERRGVGLSVRAPRDPLTVLGDPDGLEQVVLNLLDNALDASGSGQEVVLALERAGPKVVMRVRDSGVGIPPENLDRIFDPFFTTKAAGRGNGLGLAIAHDLVSGHGGAIRVSSTVDAGTEFLVELPLRRARDQP